MESVLDIQRDHPELIRKAMAKLNSDGKLISLIIFVNLRWMN